MANNFTKTMRDALQEARSFRDVQEDKGFSSAQIKMAYGVLNDPRYKQGNYSGAVKAIEKIAKGLSSHPDVANALKRANEEVELDEATYRGYEIKRQNRKDGHPLIIPDLKLTGANMKDVKRIIDRHLDENLDLPATGDTTTSNASQEVETVEEESTDEMFSTRSLGLKGASKRSRDKAREKDKDSEKSKKKEDLDEARFTPAQISALQKSYGKLGPGAEKNAVQMDKLAKMMSKYSKSHLSQLADMGIPMVSKVAKELMKEELDEASRLRPTKGLYSMAQMKQQVARTEKAFNEFEQHCNFIFQMDRDVGPSMSDNSGKYFDVYSDLDDANKLIKKALADAKKIT